MKNIITAIVAVFALTANAQTYSPEQFYDAIAMVESSNNPKAVNKSEKAFGLYQIRPIYVEDCKRLSPKSDFFHAQAFNPSIARRMMKIYLEHYTKVDLDKPLTLANIETLTRTHNGGPRGAKKQATLKYWDKVKKELNK